MNGTVYTEVEEMCRLLRLDLSADEFAAFVEREGFTPGQTAAIGAMFRHLGDKKNETIINTLLKMSRLPIKDPKTFEGFDFSQVHGRSADKLRSLPQLSALYAHRNLAFIGPQGVGKTHLAMAYGRECCLNGLKTYFLKASELDQKLTDARRYGHIGSVVNSLVKPSCLIIDEIGRCEFNEYNTRLFFDVIDRRTAKEGPNTIIFTSNKTPKDWRPYFHEDDSLLCALDRAFDDATVFMFRGDSYRGRKLETISLEVGPRK